MTTHTAHIIQIDGEPADWAIDEAGSLSEARQAAAMHLAGCSPADSARGVVIRDPDGQIVASLRLNEWRIKDKLIQGPDWSFAAIVSGMIDNPAYDPDGWRA